jgi:hypothetical protein
LKEDFYMQRFLKTIALVATISIASSTYAAAVQVHNDTFTTLINVYVKKSDGGKVPLSNNEVIRRGDNGQKVLVIAGKTYTAVAEITAYDTHLARNNSDIINHYKVQCNTIEATKSHKITNPLKIDCFLVKK